MSADRIAATFAQDFTIWNESKGGGLFSKAADWTSPIRWRSGPARFLLPSRFRYFCGAAWFIEIAAGRAAHFSMYP